jgi:hypothetical protein
MLHKALNTSSIESPTSRHNLKLAFYKKKLWHCRSPQPKGTKSPGHGRRSEWRPTAPRCSRSSTTAPSADRTTAQRSCPQHYREDVIGFWIDMVTWN